ncbi:DUF3310 domain-containing protein [Mammaliicoccus sciuri]|uniref:DUF3310 domain-containing protein n=1 Tax=Mammaliicoccus sciuri TaxID=1296 RepID=UPI0021CE171F|nr:DUF3310 domain-containing protein [Mammaliicoccus sciuri]UXV30005.1 DUF3310 domain-containing protein [Mammaliicoccus sciuri]
MLMEFKAGDRVHATRLNGRDVNIYGILGNAGQFAGKLLDCKNGEFISGIYLPNSSNFGLNKTDYYTLATDEEDTEEPVIQRITDTVNHPSHYNFGDIEVVDFIEQVTKHYNSDVAYHIGNAIKYISRAPHKNGKEDIAKAKWYIERAFDKWE